MSPSRAARLLSMVSDTSDPGRLANSLLLTPSVLRAFQNGHLQVRLHSAKSWNDLDEDGGKDELKSGVSTSNPHPHITISFYLFTSILSCPYIQKSTRILFSRTGLH